MPIGFKNGTSGNMQIAVDGIISAAHPHSFLSVTKQGVSAIVSTSGNDSCHLILRGSSQGPNFGAEFVAKAWNIQQRAGISNRIMIDCSHGNSHKKWQEQPDVAADIAAQLAAGSQSIGAVMIESNICSGSQKCQKPLKYGVSITDGCIDWDGTLAMLDTLAKGVRERRRKPAPEKGNSRRSERKVSTPIRPRPHGRFPCPPWLPTTLKQKITLPCNFTLAFRPKFAILSSQRFR